MYTFYSSVCNLLGSKQKPTVDVSKSTNLQKKPTIKKDENDYVIAKNEADETIILEVPKKPKFRYSLY